MARNLALPLVLAAAACTAPPPTTGGIAEDFLASGDERTSPAEDELVWAGAAEWAGDYSAGGIFVVTRIELRPGAGFVLRHRGCCVGWNNETTGDLTFAGDRVRLTLTGGNDPGSFELAGPELLLVRWGPRHYLVQPSHLVDFCNGVNGGSEPRSSSCCGAFLKVGEEAWSAPGWPELPPEAAGLLLPEPVDATIVAAGERQKHGLLATPVQLDAGSLDGLRVGMWLYADLDAGLCPIVRLTRAEERRAEGVLTQYSDCDPAPRPGWRVSTWPPWKPRPLAPMCPMEPAPPAR